MRRSHIALYVFSIGVLLGLSGCYNQEAEIVENEARARDLIVALELYAQTYGVYPNTLDELNPEFVDHIPLTVDGEAFRYRNYADPELMYRLAFSVNAEYGCGYEAKFAVWECSSDPE